MKNRRIFKRHTLPYVGESLSFESKFGSKNRLANQGTPIPAGIAPKMMAQIDGNRGGAGDPR